MLDSVRAGEEFERVSGRVYEASNKEDVFARGASAASQRGGRLPWHCPCTWLVKMTLLSSCIHLASDFALVLLFRALNGSSTERQYILAITLFTMQEACT